MLIYLNKPFEAHPLPLFQLSVTHHDGLYSGEYAPIVEVNYRRETIFPLKIPILLKHHFIISVHREKSLHSENKFETRE